MFKEHPLMALYPTEFTVGLQDVDGPLFNQPNTALLSLVLMIGTFFIAFFLRKFRNSRFLGGKVRNCPSVHTCVRNEWCFFFLEL